MQWKQKHKQQEQRDISRCLATSSHLQDTGDGSYMAHMQKLQKELEVSLAETEMKWRQRAK